MSAKPVAGKQVFVSHSTQNADFAHRLAQDLQSNGLRPWISPDSIPSGELWVLAIQKGLEKSDAYVVAMSPAAVESKWVQIEASIAIQQAVQNDRLFIPLDFQACQVPLIWTAYQRVSFRDSYQNGLQELLSCLTKPTTPSMPAAPSPSFAPTTRGSAIRIPKQLTPETNVARAAIDALVNQAKSITWSPKGLPTSIINNQTALYKFAQANKLEYPQTDEFEFNLGVDRYIGQVYNGGMVYVKKGDWGNCQWVKKP